MQTFPKGARVCFVGDSLVAMNQTLPRIIDYYNKFMSDRKVAFFDLIFDKGLKASIKAKNTRLQWWRLKKIIHKN